MTPIPRRRTPTVLQMEAVECGAASLAMILAHHGLWLPLEDLRQECGVSRDGSKASNLLRAARRHGVVAKGFSLDPERLATLPMPAMVFVNMNHFLVLEGRNAKGYWLNDPAVGRRFVSIAEFDRMFSGIVLTFAPTPAFARGGTPPSPYADLRRLLGRSPPAVAFFLAASLTLIVPGLLVPAFSRIFVDYYLIDRMEHWVAPLLLGMVATLTLQGLLSWLRDHVLLRLETRLTTTGVSHFVWHSLRLPVAFYGQRYAGAVAARVQLLPRLSLLAAHELPRALFHLTSAVVFAALMLQYHATLAALSVAFALANAAVFTWLDRRLVEYSQKKTLDETRLMGKTMQGIQMIETLKASGTERVFFGHWAGLQALVALGEYQIGIRQALLASLPSLLTLLNAAAVLVLGGLFVISGEMTIGMLVGFQALLVAFTRPVEALIQSGTVLQETKGILAQVNDVLNYPEDPEFAAATASVGRQPLKLSGRLSVRGLTFGYNPVEPPLIRDFDLDIAPGARIALVGPSGSGKSTVGKLLTGLYRPWSGEIHLDGRPLAEVPRQVLRNSLAVVDQEIVLFEGSVRDNIALWDDTLPDDMVVRAAQDAMIHDAVIERPGGYDAPIEENGRNFSGGQRQRLEIARALACAPSLLVLDEATSALDPVTEKAVIDNIRRRGCACLIVAHRLSTIRDADEIIVMDRGRILQRGTHAELRQADGLYRTLIET